MPFVKIITPDGISSVSAPAGETLAEIILSAGIIFDRPCAGRGKCTKCKVEVQGKLSPLTDVEEKNLSREEIEASIRLACQARVRGDAQVKVQAGAVHTDKIFGAKVDADALEGDIGLAVDLGTTTVGAFLVTLEECRVHAGFAVLNQQISFGAEIISRMAAAESGKARELKSLARESVHDAVAGLRLSGAVRERIKSAVVVGNTAMHHLALGLPVNTLVRLPFQPHTLETLQAEKGFMGKGFPEDLPVVFPPVIGGFVGTDALACLLYFGFDDLKEPSVAVDLGTNGEIMIKDGQDVRVASTAAGPAFEGVNISCGMRALPGAITKAGLDSSGDVKLTTIENAEPRGIAGSGLLSLINLMIQKGLVATNGRIIDPESQKLNRIDIAPGVYLSQEDIREVQKAKGAIRCAIDTLIEREGVRPEKLCRLVLTGSFGGQVDVDDALALGIIPPVPRDIVRSIPNGAGMGAALMLKQDNMERAVELSQKAGHVELNADQEFMDRYVSSMEFG